MAKKKSVRKAGKDGTRMMIHQRVHNVFFLSEESNSWLKLDMVGNYTTPETNMTMEKQQFEDVSSFKTGDFPLTC